MDNGLRSRNYKEMKNNKYKFKPIGGWDDTTSWITILLIMVGFFANVFWSFN
jgi:hypothetical protein